MVKALDVLSVPVQVALLAMLAVTWGCAHKPALRQASEANTPDVIVIDGARTPELIPAYVVWQNVLSSITILGPEGMRSLPEDKLRTTPGDMEHILTAGTWYELHRERCGQRQDREAERLRNLKRGPSEIDLAQKAIILDCRYAVLDRVETLLNILSPETRGSLLMWAEGRKAGMRSVVPRSELDFYRQPR